jgi:hypothetical protein
MKQEKPMTPRQHSCERELERVRFVVGGDTHDVRGQASVPSGTKWTCPCGRKWIHDCDEAEGCAWFPAK